MEELAPPYLALENDPVGLQVGSPEEYLENVLVTLEVTPSVVQEAVDRGVNLIISHHPLIFQPLTSLDYRTTTGRLIKSLVQNGINLFVAHTNLDIAPRGLNFVLSDIFDLNIKGVLQPTYRDRLLKLVVFIPSGYGEKVREAVTEAGAGWLGRYSHCTFTAEGRGTFLPREGTSPFTGEQGKLDEVEEVRLETVLPAFLEKPVIDALVESHPYEEPAYDLSPVEGTGRVLGLGAWGELPEPYTVQGLAEKCRDSLGLEGVKVAGNLSARVSSVAVCGGSGSSLISRAADLGAEAIISGDLKHHDIQEGLYRGLAVIDAGHCGTEKPVAGYLAGYLRDNLQLQGISREVIVSDMWELGNGHLV